VLELCGGQRAPADDGPIEVANACLGLHGSVEGDRARISQSRRRDSPANRTGIGAIQRIINRTTKRVGIGDDEAETVADRPTILIEGGRIKIRPAGELCLLAVGHTLIKAQIGSWL